MNAQLIGCTLRRAVLWIMLPAASFAGHFNVDIAVGFAPPALPVYVQPPCPAPGYLWTPGYWAFSDEEEDYHWVPGTWVVAPAAGLLWTPGYWAGSDDGFLWHAGYWAPHVGFYGGINYGFGYFGDGFAGGYWRGHDYFYNRAVNNVSTTYITHVYNGPSRRYGEASRPSVFVGNGGHAHPTHGDWGRAQESHRGPTPPVPAFAAAPRPYVAYRPERQQWLQRQQQPQQQAQPQRQGWSQPRLLARAQISSRPAFNPPRGIAQGELAARRGGSAPQDAQRRR